MKAVLLPRPKKGVTPRLIEADKSQGRLDLADVRWAASWAFLDPCRSKIVTVVSLSLASIEYHNSLRLSSKKTGPPW